MKFDVSFRSSMEYLHFIVIGQNILCNLILVNFIKEKFAKDVHSKILNYVNKIIMTKEMMEKQVWR